MNRDAIDYLTYLESSDPFFYKNFKDFIIYASGLNKNLKDEEYNDLKESKEADYKISLKDKKTSVNIIKNFFYKISPSIIKQIDYDVTNGNILFLSKEKMGDVSSRIIVRDNNYKIEILDSNKIEESFLLAREYSQLFVGNLLDIDDYDRGLKRVYVEVIASLTEFALAKHLSFNTTLCKDSRNYINKKIYDSIYKMNDSYSTLTYLSYLLEEKSREEIVKLLGDEKTVDRLDKIVKNKKPCNDYINTLGTMIALKEANNCDNIYDMVNTYYIKATCNDFPFLEENIKVSLDQMETVDEITYYIRNNK